MPHRHPAMRFSKLLPRGHHLQLGRALHPTWRNLLRWRAVVSRGSILYRRGIALLGPRIKAMRQWQGLPARHGVHGQRRMPKNNGSGTTAGSGRRSHDRLSAWRWVLKSGLVSVRRNRVRMPPRLQMLQGAWLRSGQGHRLRLWQMVQAGRAVPARRRMCVPIAPACILPRAPDLPISAQNVRSESGP